MLVFKLHVFWPTRNSFGVSPLPPEKHIYAVVQPLLFHNVLSVRTLKRNGELL